MATSTVKNQGWKLVGSGGVNTQVALPSGWQELLVKFRVGTSAQCFWTTALKESSDQVINVGEPSTSGGGAIIGYNNTAIVLQTLKWYGSERSDATITVYYR